MKKISIILLLSLLQICCSIAQSSKLTIKPKRANAFYEQLSQAVLIVPIRNKNNPEDKALLEALKKYWTICPYKTMSEKEFSELPLNHAPISPQVFYLVKETYEWLKPRKKDWAYIKYFISPQYQWVEEFKQPYIEFKLPLKTVSGNPTELSYAYLYDLMIKHFNSELKLIKNPDAYAASFSRKKLQKVNFKHSLKEYRDKKLLITKNELESFMINLPDDEKDVTEQQAKFIKSISKFTKMKKENIIMVSPEEIKKAVDKPDGNSLIYIGYSIYDPQTNLMLRRIDAHRGARPFYWVISIVLATGVVIVSLKAGGWL